MWRAPSGLVVVGVVFPTPTTQSMKSCCVYEMKSPLIISNQSDMCEDTGGLIGACVRISSAFSVDASRQPRPDVREGCAGMQRDHWWTHPDATGATSDNRAGDLWRGQ